MTTTEATTQTKTAVVTLWMDSEKKTEIFPFRENPQIKCNIIRATCDNEWRYGKERHLRKLRIVLTRWIFGSVDKNVKICTRAFYKNSLNFPRQPVDQDDRVIGNGCRLGPAKQTMSRDNAKEIRIRDWLGRQRINNCTNPEMDNYKIT